MENIDSGDLVRIVYVDANGVGSDSAVDAGNLFDGIGVGYDTGDAVEQGTSRTTAVEINSYAGAITLYSAAGSTSPASFTVTNDKVRATDVVVLSQKSGTDKYDLSVSAVADGSFQITFNTKSGTTSEQPVINFAVVRAAAA